MSFFFDGREIKDEFDLFCVVYEIDGALESMMKKVYLNSGEDLGAVEGVLMQMGHEGVKKEVLDHTWSNIRERESVSKIARRQATRDLAERNAKSIKEALILGRSKEREGD